jgi:hypothetical protein
MATPDERIAGGQIFGLFLVGSSMVIPRGAILLFWIFSDLLGDAFSGWVLPALGFLLLPWTTMTYALFWGVGSNELQGIEWLPVAFALLLDLATWAGARRVTS